MSSNGINLNVVFIIIYKMAWILLFGASVVKEFHLEYQ
jgi:hypothetical protein